MPCTLCGQKVQDAYRIEEEGWSFCCHGCHAVFKILQVQGETDNYLAHPIFTQAVEAGLISNPLAWEKLQEKEKAENPKEVRKCHVEIEDMWCTSCAMVIRLVLGQHKGVKRCVVDYTTDLACIEYYPIDLSKDELFVQIKKLGYGVRELQDAANRSVNRSLLFRFAVAAFCAFNIMMFAYPLYATYFDYDSEGYGHLFAWLSAFTALPVVTYCAWPIYRRFVSALGIGVVGMEALATIGVGSATLYSFMQLAKGSNEVYFDSMSVIVALMLLGKIIESKAKIHTKESLWQLHRALPRKGRKVFSDGTIAFVSIKEIGIGDVVVVNAGEKLIVDGIVVGGEGACDESFLTGESMPVWKQASAKVMGGTLLRQGSLRVRAEKLVAESSLYHLVDLVEQEMGRKTSDDRLADRIAAWFIPLVLTLALLAAFYAGWASTADPLFIFLSVLLISCPCALGIAAPLAEAYFIHQAASLGAIIRNRACLRDLGRETVYVFDKTGTVTQGKFRLLSGLENISEEHLRWLKTLVVHSNHPIAQAIDQTLTVRPYESVVTETPGKGVRCGDFLLGSDDYLRAQQIALPQQSDTTWTRVYFACQTKVIAILELGDPVRPEMQKIIQSLAKRVILLSGDAEGAVKACAAECGIQEWKARCSPLEKKQVIAHLRQQGEVVAMVGDGINDALALGEAHVGIAVVHASDISIQISDILLTTPALQILPQLSRLGRKCQTIIKQNLFWAFIYNVAGIGLAMAGWLSPLFAAGAMTLSSLMVLFNARRLLKKF